MLISNPYTLYIIQYTIPYTKYIPYTNPNTTPYTLYTRHTAPYITPAMFPILLAILFPNTTERHITCYLPTFLNLIYHHI